MKKIIVFLLLPLLMFCFLLGAKLTKRKERKHSIQAPRQLIDIVNRDGRTIEMQANRVQQIYDIVDNY